MTIDGISFAPLHTNTSTPQRIDGPVTRMSDRRGNARTRVHRDSITITSRIFISDSAITKRL